VEVHPETFAVDLDQTNLLRGSAVRG
jgi:hypothetical protein